MMQQTCNNEKIVEIQSKGKCPHPSRSCHQMRSNDEICTCPQGVDSPKCDKCMPGFWAYTSMYQCNYLSQWWVEFEFDLTWDCL